MQLPSPCPCIGVYSPEDGMLLFPDVAVTAVQVFDNSVEFVKPKGLEQALSKVSLR